MKHLFVDNFAGGGGHRHYKFCPWCGAKMDGEHEQTT